MTYVEKKIAYLEARKLKYQEILSKSIFSKEFYNWMHQELLGEPNYTPQKMQHLGIPSFEFKRIIEQEEKNSKQTFDFIMEHVAMNAPFSTEFMKKIHTFLLNDIIYNAGEYRYDAVRMANTAITPINPEEIKRKMCDVEESYYQSKDPIRSVLDLNYEIIVSQPFADGNKRVARLLMNHELMRKGYCPLFVYKADRDSYLSAVENRFIGKGLEDYYHFMLKEMEETMDRSIAILTGENSKNLRHQDVSVQTALQQRRELSRS